MPDREPGLLHVLDPETKWLNPHKPFDPTGKCRWCNRYCLRCRYPIDAGREHIEQVQPEGASHVVCKLARTQPGPMVEVISEYLDHGLHEDPDYHLWAPQS